MLRVRFNPDEIKTSRPIAPGKYGFRLKKVKEGITREKKDKKWTLTFEGFTGDAKDATLTRIYTEEYSEYLVALLENGYGLEMDEENGSDVDLETLIDKPIWLITDIGEFGGSKRTEMKGFQPWDPNGDDEKEALGEAA